MTNPWINLPQQLPYILPEDVERLGKLAPSLIGAARLRFDVIPLPYLGNPITAKVLLLALNPGFKEEDIQILKDNPDLLEADIKNLTFANIPPFYFLNEKFSYTGGYKWWYRRMKNFIDLLGVENVANAISCIQFFPYHSEVYAPLKELLPSQQYSFYLVREAV